MISVDLFAGGGGASLAIKQATGSEPLIAVNHCEAAIRMHAANHPRSIHLQQDVWSVDPYEVLRRQPVVDLLWASPDCTHHSRAKGGKPRSKKLRHLADVVPDWAWAVRPRMILLENVPEFEQWGPLHPETPDVPEKLRGRPIKERAGEDFRAFVERLEVMGYEVDWRVLNAADFGAPTSRRRLFLVARADGVAPAWPTPTHGPGRPRPWRSAAECIDWSIPCPSIFTRKKPLAEATQRRIAEGVRRYVLTAAQPFIVNLSHGGRGGGHAALVAAFLIKYYGTGGQWAKLAESEPMHTIVSKARMGLVTVEIDGEEWAVVDIGMRMLTPRELARAQGFPEDYVLTGTKSEQIARIGNSVSPPPARALIEAQLRAGPAEEAA